MILRVIRRFHDIKNNARVLEPGDLIKVNDSDRADDLVTRKLAVEIKPTKGAKLTELDPKPKAPPKPAKEIRAKKE